MCAVKMDLAFGGNKQAKNFEKVSSLIKPL